MINPVIILTTFISWDNYQDYHLHIKQGTEHSTAQAQVSNWTQVKLWLWSPRCKKYRMNKFGFVTCQQCFGSQVPAKWNEYWYFFNSIFICLIFNKPFVQFLTNDGTDSGDLAEIRRVYVQAIFHQTNMIAVISLEKCFETRCYTSDLDQRQFFSKCYFVNDVAHNTDHVQTRGERSSTTRLPMCQVMHKDKWGPEKTA